MNFGCSDGFDRWMLDEEQRLRDVVQRMVIKIQMAMVWFEWWNCLQDGQCCPFTFGSCILYFGREGVP